MASGNQEAAKAVYPKALAALLKAKRNDTAGNLVTEAALAAELLADTAWRDDALKRAHEIIPLMSYSSNAIARLASLLFDISQGEQAVNLARIAYEKDLQKRKTERSFYLPPSPSTYAVEYANTLLRAGRYADVLTLLKESPLWNAPDLRDILSARADDQMPLGYTAAVASNEQGDTEKARAILRQLALGSTPYDPVYELLIKLDREDQVISPLNTAVTRDPFEERP